MNTSRIGLLLFLLMGMTIQLSAQTFRLFNVRKFEPQYNYSEPAAIVYKGKVLIRTDSTGRNFVFAPGMKGKVSVCTIESASKTILPVAPIGFKVAIQDYKTNSLWMYSEETFYEVEIARILKECARGDTLIFMPVDRNYRLPQHKIVVMDGC